MFSVYVSNDAIGLLLERKSLIEKYEKQDMIIELIDSAPLSAQIIYDKDIEVLIYIRDSVHSNYQVAHQGRIQGEDITVDEGDEETMLLVSDLAEAINAFLFDNNMMDKCKTLDNEIARVLFDIDYKGEITAEIVEGKKRPSLLCVSVLGELQMMRPYMNEIMKKSVLEMMSVTELEEMAGEGDVDAMEHLADLYFEGDDEVEQNPEKSLYWIIKFADSGNSTAMYNVGLRKAKGFGTDRNLNEAAAWMQKAAEAGDEDGAVLAKRYKEIADSKDMAKKGMLKLRQYMLRDLWN